MDSPKVWKKVQNYNHLENSRADLAVKVIFCKKIENDSPQMVMYKVWKNGNLKMAKIDIQNNLLHKMF